MGMYIILISLALIDIALLIYILYYYFTQYKKGLDKIEEVINKLPSKNENEENKVIELKQKILFNDAFILLNDQQKSYYEEIKNYALSFENTFIYSYDYDNRIRVGQRKTLAIISIKNQNLVVKFKMGNIKIDENESIELKPIKITVKNDDDLNEVKKQINIAYNKQTGHLSINMEGEK